MVYRLMFSEKEPFPFVGGSMDLPYMPGAAASPRRASHALRDA